MTKHIVNIDAEADEAEVIYNLSILGTITKMFETSRVVEVEGTKEDIEAVIGVESCCCDSEVVVKLDVLTADQWGLGAISNHLDQTEYLFDADGTGVNIYLADTLAEPSLPEFGGRLSIIHDPDLLPLTVQHGTLTASWAGGLTSGVAKGATLYNAAAFNGSGVGTLVSIVSAFDVIANHIEANPPTKTPIVSASLSITGQIGNPLSAVVDRLRALGAIVVASSGNDTFDFNDPFQFVRVWPAEDPDVFTVGAVDKLYARPSWSNQGNEVNIHAPGVQCSAVDHLGVTITADGTSISAPYVAGCLACAVQADIADPEAWLLTMAKLGVLVGPNTGSDGILHKPSAILATTAPPQEAPLSTWYPAFINVPDSTLQGPKGDTGDQGLQGDQGIQGEQGLQGDPGTGGGGGVSYSEVIDMSTFLGTHEIDVTGLKTVRLITHDMLGAAGAGVLVFLSSDGGLTWYENYLRRTADTTGVVSVPYMMIDGNAAASKIFSAEIRNLDTQGPTYMEAVEWIGNRKRWETIHTTAVNINRIKISATVGIGGSIYVEGF